MKKLLTVLTIALILTGCGIFGDDGGDTKEFEPFTAGNWHVETNTNAVYLGNSASKEPPTTERVDTSYITNPDSTHLEITRDDNLTNGFTIIFETPNVLDEDIVGTYTTVDFLDEVFIGLDNQNNYGQRFNHFVEFTRFEFDFKYDCVTDFNDSKIIFTVYEDKQEPFRVYEINNTDGFLEAVKVVANCETNL